MVGAKIYFNWSSGKDSALALYYLLRDRRYDVRYLLTSVNAHHNRVSMHGLRRELLLQQVSALNIPHGTIELPEQPSNTDYEKSMATKVRDLHADGFHTAAFGDIFLEDLRQYREQQLKPLGIECVFPLWKKDTRKLMEEFLSLGFKAITVCVNGALLDESFVGKVIDKDFIDRLPEGVDPCGENGEFHTFCFDGPIFSNPISFTIGEVVAREYTEGERVHRFWFCDLLPT